MSAPAIAVVGGGLAGLTAAIACMDAGARVQLFESRPRLGGATWSTRSRGLAIDNGQHVFLRCCDRYTGLLRRLGVRDKVTIQPRLEVPVLSPGRRPAWIRRYGLPAPAHLAPSLLRFSPLRPRERLRAALTAQRMRALDPADPAVDATSLGDWLSRQGESAASIDNFWDLLIRPTLNLPAREAALSLSAVVFQTGLLSAPEAADIGHANVPLQELHAEPAAAALRKGGGRVFPRAMVSSIECREGGPLALIAGGDRVEADAIVLATPHAAAARLLPDAAGVDAAALLRLGASPIVNLHVHFDRRVLDFPFAAAIASPLQWIFDRSAAAGVDEGQYVCVSLSAANEYAGRSRAELRRIFLPAFGRLLPAARYARVIDFFTTCEREATFLQRPGTTSLRPGPLTRVPGLILAGAWTDTGWPATMEGAVRSGLEAARAALRAAGRTRGLPAEAA